MLRRMATVVAATTALALAGAAPALADHDEVTDPYLIQGDNPTCEDVAADFDDLEDVEELDKKEFKDDQPSKWTVDPADYPGYDIFVIVKGGNAANVYFSNFTDMVAPNNASGKPADISHVTVCGVKTTETETPKPDETETPKPDETETPKPDETETPKPDDKETPKPDDKETPKPVPTSVPAGYGEADNGSASTTGLLAFVAALAVGGAAFFTRRFLKDN